MSDDAGVEYTLPEGVTGDSSPTITPTTPPQTPAGTVPGGEQPVEEQRVPYSRFKETITARDAAAREAAEARAESAILKRQIEALTGVRREAEADPQEAAIKAALFKVFPALKHLESLPFDRLQEVLETVPQLQASQQSQYDQLADATTANLYREAKATFGGEELNEDQRSFLHSAFVRWMEQNPAQLQKYTFRDPSVVTTFLQHFTAKMLDPVRRQAAVTVGARQARTAVAPTAGSASGPIGTAPPTIPAGDEDARHEAAWQSFKAKAGM
jgi:hypothetical protein